jgi:8-oxo-dGTP pyrophosphatase MutT (NUDIX family)
VKVAELFEAVGKAGKAGFMPYVLEGDVPIYLFMVSSASQYGGADPQISKGHIDAGEDAKTAGVREAEEELGLRKSNLISTIEGWSGTQTGLDATYKMTIFAGQVKSKSAFDKPHYETKETVWLSAADFATKGRKAQNSIVAAVDKSVRASLQST